MGRLKMFGLLVLVSTGGFFSGGCTQTQRKEILDEVKQYGIDEFNKLKPQIVALVDAKIAEKETAQLAELDKALVPFGKTWKDFDADKDGHLSLVEVGKASAFIAAETGKKVATGEWTTEDAKKYGKGAAVPLAILALIALARKFGPKMAAPASPPAPAAPPVGGK